MQATAKEPIVTRAVFTAGGVDYTWGDVAVAARLRGDWAALEADVRQGLAALAELHSRGDAIDGSELQAAGAAFRYRRDLLAGDEIVAWLERWDLTTLEWTDWLGRTLARERLEGDADDLVALHRPDPDETETAAGVEAVCSGALERWADELAKCAAVALATGLRAEPAAQHDPPPARGVLGLAPTDWEAATVKVAALRLDLDRVLGEIVDSSAVDREVTLHRVDWLAFDLRTLRFRRECTAREALLCLRDDGYTVDQVSVAAGVSAEHTQLLLEDVPESLQAALLGARDGELVGPLADGDEHLVIVVDSKRAPMSGDEHTVARARGVALERALRREVEARVQWHEQI